MTFDLRAYWPDPAAGKQVIAQFATAAHTSLLRRYVRRGTIGGAPVAQMDEWSAQGWCDAWQYRDDGTQILEVATKQPGVHKVYKPGKEIQWGGAQQIGDVVARSVEIDVAASTGVAPGIGNYGYQKIEFEAFHPVFLNAALNLYQDVAQFKVLQTWCADAGCAYPAGQHVYRQRYWMAPGLGFVQIEYLEPVQRIDYPKFIETTWETTCQ
jgi:hypothetical protein